MQMTARCSPYERALGEAVNELHPSLRAYVAAHPVGHVGVGTGVFTAAGASRAWLRPLLRLLERHGVAAGETGVDVPFTVRNRWVDGQVRADRTFRFPHSTWTMRDAVRATSSGRLVDELGAPSRVHAVFDASVEDGTLVLTSTRVGVRFGRARCRLPRVVAPRITLRESHDEPTGRQRVDVSVSVPVIGRVYGYCGTFDYRIEQEDV